MEQNCCIQSSGSQHGSASYQMYIEEF